MEVGRARGRGLVAWPSGGVGRGGEYVCSFFPSSECGFHYESHKRVYYKQSRSVNRSLFVVAEFIPKHSDAQETR